MPLPMDGNDKIESAVKRYLDSQGILRNSKDVLRREFMEKYPGSADLLRHGRRGTPAFTHPNYYDFWQQLDTFYDRRVLTLGYLARELSGKRGITILDAGCASGIDACFLAHYFPGNRVIGYDIDERMVGKANARKGSLKNALFRKESHFTDCRLKGYADIALLLDAGHADDEELGTIARNAAKRLKENATLYVRTENELPRLKGMQALDTRLIGNIHYLPGEELRLYMHKLATGKQD